MTIASERAADGTSSRSDEQRLMDGIYWYGIPTLFRCKYDPDPQNADIALVGVPHSTGNGTTQRDQHLGPRAVRDVSAIGRRVHGQFGIDPWEMCRINDLGDVPLSEGNNNERSIEMITDFYRSIDAAGARPVSIGGDHSITGGILQAIGGPEANLTGGERACLLHFDAHTDAFHNIPHFMGAIKSAAHWASYLVTDGHVDAEHSVQVGIRGNTRSLDWLEPSYSLGYEVIKKSDYDQMGAERVIEIIHDRIGDRPVYITFDLDCLDPTVAPGVANIEAGIDGFGMDQAMELIRSMRGRNVIGGDVVCLMPTVDSPNQITSYRSMSVMFEILSLIADRNFNLP
ncbi:MAG: agmatinase [Acidimicrobiia bacterium]|nr:agmatinase [Acidimicrobiia bacterium]MYE73176.1 agmatinase [Acidimicrobiia bacterium]MYJ32140.1 agmatinase [Acidimicrobiia bacterium]MYJ60831.1 agmatinase [Acidimicrobiia bacterium]